MVRMLQTVSHRLERQKKTVLIGVGFLLAVFVWMLWIGPWALRLPANFSFTADIVSVDNFYDAERQAYTGGVYSKTTYGYETVSVEGGLQTVKNYFSVKTPEGEPIFSVDRLYGVNRQTRAHVPEAGDTARTGYLFAPRNLRKGQSFTYWHINYDGPASMQFAEEERLYGLRVFRYETKYDGITIDQTEQLGHLPGVGETRGIKLEPALTIWVEPASGRLVKYTDDTIAYYYDLKTGKRLHPWNRFSNTFDERSVDRAITIARGERTKIQALQYYVPAALLIAAIFFIGRALRLWRMVAVLLPLRRVSMVVGCATVLVACAALVGWGLGNESLIRIVPSAGAMNPVTAILFVLLGLAVMVRPLWRGKVTATLGTVVAIVGLIRMANFFGIISVDIDLLVFEEAVSALDRARMAEYTAISFVLVGAALAVPVAGFLQRIRLSEIATTTVLVLSGFVMVGYLFTSFELLAVPIFVSAAIHTAALFFLNAILLQVILRTEASRPLPLLSWFSVSSILFVTVFATVFLAGLIDRNLSDEARSQFSAIADQRTDDIVNRLEIYINVLNGGKGLLAASEEVTRSEWKAYVDSLNIQKNYPGIQGIGYAVFVQPQDLPQHIDKIRADGFPGYTVHPAGDRDQYSAVIYLEPFNARNQQAFGFDMFQEPVRRAGMEQARDTGNPRLSGKITLVQEIDADVQPGFLIYVPVYGNASEPTSLDDRRKEILGYVYSPFRARDFVEGVIGKEGISNMSLTIHDGTDRPNSSILYSDYNEKQPPNTQPRFQETRTIYVAGRPWALTFQSTPSFTTVSLVDRAPLFILAVGIAMSVLLSTLFYILLSSRQRAIAYAEEVTKSLREANTRLSTSREELALHTQELEESQAALAEAQRIGNFGNFVWNLKTNEVQWSDESFRIHGWRPAKDHTPPSLEQYFKVIHPDDRKAARASVRAATKSKEENRYMYRVTWPNGSVHFVRVASKLTLDSKGRPEVVNGTFQDITREQEIDRAKSEFVSLASHQLRTPLSAINWYVEMLLSGDAGRLTKDQKGYLNEINQGNQRMIELVGALLDVSRLELGTFAVEPKATDVVSIAKDVVKEMQPTIIDKQQIVNERYDKTVPGSLQLDPKLIRIVIQNLVSNAVKYTPKKGEITVSVRLTKQDTIPEESRVQGDASLQVSVIDNGQGIPAADQDKIFAKLYRASNAVTSDTQGTGLGLYIIKTIIEESGGHVWFESEQNKGTSFHVNLPKTGMQKKSGSKKLGE